MHPSDLPEDPESSLRSQSSGTDGPLIESGRGSSSWRLRLEDGAQGDRDSGEECSYILRRRVGRGGMGEVWEALQVSLGRVVAVKRVREDKPPYSGGTPEECSLRAWEFRREGIIAARLEHPNIVPVHDLGEDDSGRPLLAMKLVRGRPWNKVIREDFADLPTNVYYAKHLPILVSVVQAVAFAHAHEILHRDLKPSQVMVGDFGEVLLMDWGLAVYMGSDPLPKGHPDPITASPTTLKTASNPAGTPVMMAPEQTEKSTARLGTWTDVYLLGGILYFLLTSRYPHAAEDSAAAMRHAAAGFVRPPGEAAPGREIPEGLAELAMRALRPEPGDRVPSARAFLAALEDHLSGATRRREAESIVRTTREALANAGASYDELSHCLEELRRAGELWPEGAPVRELRGRVLEAFAMAALDAGDLRLAHLHADHMEGEARVAMLAYVERAAAAKRAAERQRRLLARTSAVLAAMLVLGGVAFTASLWDAKQRIARERDLGEDLVAFMIDDLSDSLRGIGRIALLRDVADKSVEYYNAVEEGNPTADSTIRRARALAQIGDVYAAQNLTRSARETYERALEAIAPAAEGPLATDEGRNFGAAVEGRILSLDIGAGRYGEALERGNHVVGIRRGLVRTNASKPGKPYRADLAASLAKVATIHLRTGRPAEALACLMEAREIINQVVADHPRAETRDVRYNLSAHLNDMAQAYADLGDAAAADEARRASVETMRELVREAPDATDYAEYLATAINNLAIADSKFENTSESIRLRTEATDIMRSLVHRDPLNDEWKRMLSVHLVNLARTIAETGEPGEGLRLLDEADTIDRRLLETSPDRPDIVLATHNTAIARGAILNQMGRPEDSLAAYEIAIGRIERADALAPRNAATRKALATALNETAFPWFALGRLDKAIAALERSYDVITEALQWAPEDLEHKSSIYPLASNLAHLWEKHGDPQKAREWRRTGLRLSEELVAASPRNPAFLNYHVLALEAWTKSLEASGEYEEALQFARRIPEPAATLRELGGPPSTAVRLANSHLLQARYLRLLRRHEESAREAAEGTRLAEGFAKEFPAERLHPMMVRSGYFAQGRALHMAGRVEDARPLLQKAVELLESAPDADARDRMNLAEALLRLGEVARARPIVGELASEADLDPTLRELATQNGITLPQDSGTAPP